MTATSEAPAVVAQALRKAYGQIVAVDDLSFEVQPGEILGVLGPNGAGKTTAIRVLTTILEPTHGAFRARKRRVSRAANRRRVPPVSRTPVRTHDGECIALRIRRRRP